MKAHSWWAPAAFAALVLTGGCGSGRKPLPSVDPKLQAELIRWFDEAGLPPAEYVAGLFDDHDVVLLGEQHRIRHDELFVQSLLKPLYEAGVRTLATEFGRREDQQLIDSLLAGADWDEDLAREVVFRQFVWWGYREYVDIYRAAWELDRSLPDGAPPFRILGINDSPDWSYIEKEEDRDEREVLRKVWRESGEDRWAAVILAVAEDGEKVLAHMGIHHAFTEYRQPYVVDGEFRNFVGQLRCGNHVYDAIGKRAVTVYLHAPWPGSEGYDSKATLPADGIIDAVMIAAGPRPVGFDVDGSPLADVTLHDALYHHGYENFTAATFCDGWIYFKPIGEYEGVTPIPGWFNEGNLVRARAQSPNPAFRDASLEEFESGLVRDADIPRKWSHLR